MSRHSLFLWFLVCIWCSLILFFTLSPRFTADATRAQVTRVIPVAPNSEPAPAPPPATPATDRPKVQKPDPVLEQVNYWLRRSAHVWLYGVLGWLLVQALTRSSRNRPVYLATILGFLMAGLDESIQSRLPFRSGKLTDVWLDTAAVAGGALLSTGLSRLRRPRTGILQAVTMGEVGGAQKVVLSLVCATAADMPTTLITGPGGDLANWVRSMNHPARVHELRSLQARPSIGQDLKTFWYLLRLLRAERPLILHLHSSKMGLLGRVAGWLTGVPYVIFTAHGWPFREYHGRLAKTFYTWIEKGAALLTDKIVCVSESERQMALRLRVARPGKLQVIRNGVSPAPAERGHLRSLLTAEADTPLVVAIGRLAEPKDPLLFIEMAARLPQARFVWIGDGPLRPECEQAIQELNLQDRVTFLGTREDARALLNDADIFVLPTRAEGLPLVIIEAMWAGKPVVASAVGGVPELIREGESGFLVAPGNLAAMTAAVDRLLADPDLRRRMGETGLAIARESYHEAQMTQQYLALYQHHLDQPK